MVHAFRHFEAALAPHLAVVAEEHENGVGIPRLFLGRRHKPRYATVGIFHNLQILFLMRRLQVGGHHVGRVVGNGEQRGEEGLSFGGLAAQHGQGVSEKEIVGHAEVVHAGAARIVFLRIHFRETVGAEKCVHIVVLRLVGHEKEGFISVVAQYGGQSVHALHHATFHGVAKHDGGP